MGIILSTVSMQIFQEINLPFNQKIRVLPIAYKQDSRNQLKLPKDLSVREVLLRLKPAPLYPVSHKPTTVPWNPNSTRISLSSLKHVKFQGLR